MLRKVMSAVAIVVVAGVVALSQGERRPASPAAWTMTRMTRVLARREARPPRKSSASRARLGGNSASSRTSVETALASRALR